LLSAGVGVIVFRLVTVIFEEVKMALTRWNPSNDTLFLDHEMDPIFEDNLASALNELPAVSEEEEWPDLNLSAPAALKLGLVSLPA
jgi:hypothetical protein